jgi:hypothetical protein
VNKFRICTKCEIHHYENCPNCFGFGVWSDVLGDAVTAGQSYDYKHNGEILRIPKPCPVCKSTIVGIINE